jgi:MFS transporter, FSR family, fosmidomycin resistance protein
MKARWYPVHHGLIHAIIDACCVMAVFSSRFVHDLTPDERFSLVLLYNLMAFAGQVPIGLLLDRFKIIQGAALCGIGFTALAVILFRYDPLIATIWAGLGNATFHVSAGAASLQVRPGRATQPGIFVAPGALGLLIGSWAGKNGFLVSWPFYVALGVALVIASVAKQPKVYKPSEPMKLDIRRPMLILVLLLASISIRAFVGMGGCYDCPKMVMVSIGLASAAFAGKAIGGVLADRFGWMEVTIGALLVSAPIIAFSGGNSNAMVIGMFLFQITMPVTLVAVWSLLPGRPALAFGLPCLALAVGSVPTTLGAAKQLYGPPLFLVLILVSAFLLFVSLRELKSAVPMKFRD